MKTLSISGGLAGPPSACSAAPDRLDVFAVRPGGGAVVSRWSWDGTRWQPSNLPLSGGQIPGEGLCAVSSAPGRVEVFAVEGGSRTPLWWRGDGTVWSYRGPLPPGAARLPSVPVAVVCASPDSIDVFAVGAGNTPWWWHWSGSTWSAPSPLPSGADVPAVRIAAVSPAPGRLDVFAVGRNAHLWQWSRIGVGAWSKARDLGGNVPAVGVSAVSWGPNRIDVFAASRAPGFPLQHWAWDGTRWSSDEIGQNYAEGAVSAVSHAFNRLDVFGITRDQQLAHWQWDGRFWSGPYLRGQHIPAGDVSATVRATHRLDVFVTGSGNTLRQWPGGGIENVTNQHWRNWSTNHQKSAPPGILRPDSLQEVVDIVKEAERANLPVRAVGSGWSNSDVALSEGYVVETDALGALLVDVLDTSLNDEGAALQLVHVEGGIKLNVLIHLLFKMGLALKTLGGSSGQSLAGAIANSVHGMDVDRGPLPDMVRAIHLVGPGGVEHWIEPSSRIITNREALKAALGLTDENIHYDDDWFYSVLVSMGSLGIIYSLIIEVDGRYALRQTRENIKWADIRARLAGRVNNPLDTNRGVQVALNPYPSGDGSRDCYLTTRNPDPDITGLTAPTEEEWKAKEAADLTSEFGVPALITAFQARRDVIPAGVNAVTSEQQKPEVGTEWIHDLVGGSNPGSHKGLTVELMFDARTTAYLNFVDSALEIIRRAYYEERPSLAYLGWISIRFQRRSRAYLSPQRFDLTCSIEFAAVWRTTNLATPVEWTDTPILIRRIEAEGRRLGGIQHWGMNELIDDTDVARAYPRLNTWLRVRWELTGGGTITTFDNDFTRRCGLSAAPKTSSRLPGFGTDIGVGADGSAWLIGTDPVGPVSIGSVSIGSGPGVGPRSPKFTGAGPVGGAVDFGVHQWNGTNGDWDGMDGGGVRIAVGPDGTPWLVNSFGQIFHRQGSSWGAPLPGAGKDIGVGADGSVWLIGTDPVGAAAADFGVYKWNGVTWDGVDGGGVRIAVGPDGTPWLVNSLGQIFHRQRDSWGAPLPGLGKDIGVGADGTVWLIGTNRVGAASDFGVYKWKGANWEGVADSGGVGISVGPSGQAWLVNSVGQIFLLSKS